MPPDEPDALAAMSSGGYGSGSDRAMSPPEAMSSPELTEEEMICNICLVRGHPSLLATTRSRPARAQNAAKQTVPARLQFPAPVMPQCVLASQRQSCMSSACCFAGG